MCIHLFLPIIADSNERDIVLAGQENQHLANDEKMDLVIQEDHHYGENMVAAAIQEGQLPSNDSLVVGKGTPEAEVYERGKGIVLCLCSG